MNLKELECKRCQHKWLPRSLSIKPKLCPSCKSKYWDEPRVDNKNAKGKRRVRK